MIDTVATLASVDLLALIGADVPLKKAATTNGGEYAGPCPFCGGRDRFRVWPTPRDGKPAFWCRACDAKGDAIAYAMKRDGLGFREAVAQLGGDPLPLAKSARAPIAPAAPALADPGVPSLAWQARGRAFLAESQAALWGTAGKRALAWLHTERGLSDQTIRAAGLGLLTADRAEGRELWGLPETGLVKMPRGVVIPCQAGGDLYYLKIRRPAGEPKYLNVTGGRSVALFGGDAMTGKADCLVTEGEFDCLLLWQEAGDLADVTTLGSSAGRLAGLWAVYLLQALHFWIATDADEAGETAATYWLGLVGRKGRRVPIPSGKDATDYWKAGGDLRAWLQGLLGPVDPSQLLQQEIASGLAAMHEALERGDRQTAGAIDDRTAALVERLSGATWRNR